MELASLENKGWKGCCKRLTKKSALFFFFFFLNSEMQLPLPLKKHKLELILIDQLEVGTRIRWNRLELMAPFFGLTCYSAISYCSLAGKWSKITAGYTFQILLLLLSHLEVCKDKFAFSSFLSLSLSFFLLLFFFFGPK